VNDESNGYRIQVERDDVLLFQSYPDGTMSMLAVPRDEWERRISTPATPQADALRQVFRDNGLPTPSDLVAARRTI
jgi:hypothetical protein